jgi:DNA-binding NtrC family response regulator
MYLSKTVTLIDSQGARTKNILVADDNKIFRETLASYLRSKLGEYNVLTAEDGEKAIEILESNAVSLLLTDLVMPKVDGYQVIAYVKERKPAIPVIIMTSAWSLELQVLIRKMGNAAYLEKPFHLEDIDRIVIEPLIKNEPTTSAITDG